MPYLPPIKVDGTEFPEALGPDSLTSIQMIEERWHTFYPMVQYTPILKLTTTVPNVNAPSGAAGTTKFDRLWGESVPDTPAWEQPHNTPDGRASDPAKYGPPQDIRMRIQRTMRETQLKKLGFDQIRSLIGTIPTSMLDAHGITCQAGDRFVWNNEVFEVIQWQPFGWYYNTNVCLYVVLNCQHARRGS